MGFRTADGRDGAEHGVMEANNGVFYDENGTMHVRAQTLGEGPASMIRRPRHNKSEQDSFETYHPHRQQPSQEKQEKKHEIETVENHRPGRIMLVEK